MLFTIINFMRLFALVLFFTVVQSTIGSFVVFFAFTDCIGPSNPTYAVDYVISKSKTCVERKNQDRPEVVTTDVTVPDNKDAAGKDDIDA